MTRFVTALRYLTIIPIPGVAPAHRPPGAAAAWFPAVGLAIGAVLVVVDRVSTALFAPLLATLLTMTVWKALTGGLHLDGLADCLDGMSGGNADRRLAIMRDSRIGSFGAVGLILFLLLELATISGIEGSARWRALLVAPVVGRAVPAVLARLFAPVATGRAAEFRAHLPTAAVPVALAVASAVAIAALGVRGVAAVVAAFGLTIALGAFMVRRLGGVSGDVHGAAVECGELAVLLTVAAANPAR